MGLPDSLEGTCDALTRCRLFIGCCSGVSHVAHAVGCPMILVEYTQPIRPWHPATGWTLAQGTEDLIDKVNAALGVTR
jgi:ADP-heptose:LPS heptosyltransferase